MVHVQVIQWTSSRPKLGISPPPLQICKGRIIFYEEGESVDFHFGLQDFF